ncbi:hypothetical protein Pla52o_49160 [Novipirellula galeiformis]|uniref:Uncharacterized protein n=1 Tax=Novipirellula galeiformis TaxID=2528004 RepID=A0A5C6C231_9BACT|nr:hypothetical protein [Novipirellula galeiformis]TWU17701.1 hypothetical protein Pla52o_49160 [Novipirellula galeiformis]
MVTSQPTKTQLQGFDVELRLTETNGNGATSKCVCDPTRQVLGRRADARVGAASKRVRIAMSIENNGHPVDSLMRTAMNRRRNPAFCLARQTLRQPIRSFANATSPKQM